MQYFRQLKLFFICIIVWIASPSTLALSPLPADEAFALSAKFFGDDTLVVTWDIAPDHYLYKDRIHFKMISPETSKIGTILMPKGEHQENVIFGEYEAYSNKVTIPVPILHPDPNQTNISVNFQGCAKNGYCYPPTSRELKVSFTQKTIAITKPKLQPKTTALQSTDESRENNESQEQSYISLLSSNHFAGILLAFLGFGILLSFTPCVLPMLPILSGIILGQKTHITTRKAFTLSSVYVLSMALTYAIAGIITGHLGASIQTLFQQTWIIILFSLLFTALAFSFFGFYQIKLPEKLEMKLANLSHKQKAGNYLGVALMGCLATLIVSPCVTPALVGVLSYIGKTGNATLGGFALFSMGIGMGIPLIIFGTVGGKLLPKAGKWMQTLEQAFGVLFIALAIWILDRILPSSITLLLFGTLLIVSAVYMGIFSQSTSNWFKLWKGLGYVLFIYGAFLIYGSAKGNTNLWQPLYSSASPQLSESQTPLFAQINSFDQLEKNINSAKASDKLVLLDFYADWCATCKEMEHTTFANPDIIAYVNKNYEALQIDITQNTPEDQIIMKQLGVIAPPTIIFFDSKGNIMKDAMLVGKINAKRFITHLKHTKQLGQRF